MRATTVAERLRSLRGIAELSASELARLAGMVRTHVSLIERTEGTGVQAKTLAELARVLGVSLDWLYLGRGSEPTSKTVQTAVARARRALNKAAA